LFAIGFECTSCGDRSAFEGIRTVCARCARPLRVLYDLDRVRASIDPATIRTRAKGLWRWRELLPLPEGEEPVTLGEGDTPLLAVPRLARLLGMERLEVKHEGVQPTASFKDRGMSVAVSMARSLGARILAAPSAGNAGGALAAYAARAGLASVIAMPRDTPAANIREALACGARVELLDGTIADCGAWIRDRATVQGWFDLSTLKEPYRVEGKKTLGLELAEALEGRLPDVILYPTGGGTGLVGMAKAFDELAALGWLDEETPRPRFIAVQSDGCDPIARAWSMGLDDGVPPSAPATIASGLRVPKPIGDRWMLSVIRDSAGFACTVPDAAIVPASIRLARVEGIFPAPEAGALIAALEMLLSDGRIRSNEHTVLFITGSGLKYAEAFDEAPSTA
jgi:threonine synthase